MHSGKIAMNLVMLAIFVVMVGIALQYPPQARFMPLVIGLPAIALCLRNSSSSFATTAGPEPRRP